MAAADADDLWLMAVCQRALGRQPSILGHCRLTRGGARAWLEAYTMSGHWGQASIGLPPMAHSGSEPDMRRFDPGKLRAAREKAGLTRRQVDDACGVSQDTLPKWEAGVAPNPSGNALATLAELYGCSIDDFFAEGSK